MVYVILEAIILALIGGFFALTQYEDEHHMRFFSVWRARLDRDVERTVFIVTHVDFGALVRDEARRLATRVGHDVAHVSLTLVRAIERVLTRLVRRFRTQATLDTDTRQTPREYVKTLSEFKGQLNATHPEISDIESK